VVWNQKSGFFFARLTNEGLESTALDDARRVAEFRVGQTALVLPAAGNLRRASQHRGAEDLGLKTVGGGEGDHRHVIL
jgi:hypothetical protein